MPRISKTCCSGARLNTLTRVFISTLGRRIRCLSVSRAFFYEKGWPGLIAKPLACTEQDGGGLIGSGHPSRAKDGRRMIVASQGARLQRSAKTEQIRPARVQK